jgi:hypothetical protein
LPYPQNKPNHKNMVLVQTSGGIIDGDVFYNGEWSRHPSIVIAWQELPQPYKEGGQPDTFMDDVKAALKEVNSNPEKYGIYNQTKQTPYKEGDVDDCKCLNPKSMAKNLDETVICIICRKEIKPKEGG